VNTMEEPQFVQKDVSDEIFNLSNTTANLERAAAYSEVRYNDPANDQLAVLGETKRLIIQSLASVAGTLTNLTNNLWNSLLLESDSLDTRESSLRSLNMIMAIEREKTARRDIGRLTAERQGLKDNIKCQAPASNLEKAQRYQRCKIDYAILDGLGHGVTVPEQTGPRILVNRTHSMVSGDSVAYMSSNLNNSNGALYERWVPTQTPHGMYSQDTMRTVRDPYGIPQIQNYAYSTLRRNPSQLNGNGGSHYGGSIVSHTRGSSISNYNTYSDNEVLPSPPLMSADTPDSMASIPYLHRARVIYDYDAAKPDELNLRVDAIVYVIRTNDDGWCEGIMNGVTGLLPSNYVEIIS